MDQESTNRILSFLIPFYGNSKYYEINIAEEDAIELKNKGFIDLQQSSGFFDPKFPLEDAPIMARLTEDGKNYLINSNYDKG